MRKGRIKEEEGKGRGERRKEEEERGGKENGEQENEKLVNRYGNRYRLVKGLRGNRG